MGSRFGLVIIVLILLVGVGLISETFFVNWLKNETGITYLEETADWVSSYDRNKPLEGSLNLVWIYLQPVLFLALGSLVMNKIKSRFF